LALLETSSNGRISPWGKLWFVAESLWKSTGDADFETSLEKNNLQKPIKNSVATYTGSATGA